MKVGISSPIGLYEKALPAELAWVERLKAAAEAGYDYVEISIDESDSRLARLDWSVAERKELLEAVDRTGVPVFSMCLSAHRKYPLGSASAEIRKRGMEILRKSIEFAASVGLRIIQVCGYDTFYEPSNAESQARFTGGLRRGVEWASQAGVMLGLENVDAPFLESIERALRVVNEIDSPWLQLYADIGNLVAAGYHPPAELKLAEKHLIGVHVKDALPGCLRGVGFQKGNVPFEQTFDALSDMGFCGPFTVEMWAELIDDVDPCETVKVARMFVGRLIDRKSKNSLESRGA
jgi:L-ribulose-5-phosphate 3-epimerase